MADRFRSFLGMLVAYRHRGSQYALHRHYWAKEMTKRSEFRANCSQERLLSKAEFERQFTRSREERSAALSPIIAFVVSLALLAICIAVVRFG